MQSFEKWAPFANSSKCAGIRCSHASAGNRFSLTLPLTLGPADGTPVAAPAAAAALQYTTSPSAPKVVLIEQDERDAYSGSAAGPRGGGSGGIRTASADRRRAGGAATAQRPVPTAFTVSRRVAAARLLVADDSEANRRFAAFIGRKLGCTVGAVGDGDEVVGAVTTAAAAGAPYDLVMMDLVMVCAADVRKCI